MKINLDLRCKSLISKWTSQSIPRAGAVHSLQILPVCRAWKLRTQQANCRAEGTSENLVYGS